MAGDWIKMEHDLRDKPEVIALAGKLSLHRDLVVGKLFVLWCWFDRHTQNGNAVGVTKAFVDELVAVENFASALASVGWLVVRDGAIEMPNFDRHLSKSAKNRALGKERASRFRNDASVTKALPEKRREEKSKELAKANSRAEPVSVSQIEVPSHLDTPEVAQAIEEWLTYKRLRGEGYKRPEHLSRKLAEFRQPHEFVSAVHASIGNNYSGLFPAKESFGAKTTTRVGSGQRYQGD